MTWPVTSAESVEANQTMTGATHPGENFSRISSETGRSEVSRVIAPGAMALAVTPYRASSWAAIWVKAAIPALAAP